jgi:phosphate-selective porin OprO and OprP
MGKKGFCVVIAMAFMLLLGSARVSMADSTSKLIDILIKKGVLTQDEAKQIEQEARSAEKAPPAAPAPMVQQQSAKEQANAAKPVLTTPGIEIGYKKGAYLKTKDNRFSVKLNVGVEPYFTFDSNDEKSDTTTFRLRRARVYLKGNVAYPWLKYSTQITLEGGSAGLRDAFLKSTYLKWLQPQIGQFKVPFDREFLDSGFDLELLERSIASSMFSLQRDIGLQLGGSLMHSHLNYKVGIFNGSGANQNNVNTDYMYVGRLVWMPFDKLGYSQSAVNNPKKPRLAIGLGLAYMPGLEPGERKSLAGKLGSTSVLSVDSDVFQAVADVGFAYHQLYAEGGYFYRNIDPNSPTPYGSQDAYGFYVQGGYFLIPKTFELAARYSFADPDNPNKVSNNKVSEETFGASYYFYGHRLKAQADYTHRATDSSPDDIQENIFQAAMVMMF